jgi:hypothetical protein
VLNLYLTQAVAYDDAKAGAAVAVQSFGDFQNFHPHLHVLKDPQASKFVGCQTQTAAASQRPAY